MEFFEEKGLKCPSFIVTHKGKTYYPEDEPKASHKDIKNPKDFFYVDYLNSDGQILGLLNRDYWEILDEELEELNIYIFKDTTKKEKKQIEKNAKLMNKLIKFCIKHFNDYQPDYKDC